MWMMNYSHRFRSLIAVVVLAVVGVGCEEPIGSVTFYNDSEETVLFLSANGPTATLEAAVEKWSWNPASTNPGISHSRSFDAHTGNGRPGKHEPWCVNTTYYVVKSKSGRFFQADPHAEVPDPPFEASDLEILEQLGPGWCWPEREPEYHYTGE